jgi:hypothetical protein
MNNCYNISGVTYITLRGIDDLNDASIYYQVLENGGKTYRKTWNMNAAEVKFDTPVDIYGVSTNLRTFGKYANVYIDFYTAGNSLIRTLYQYVKKADDGSYKTNWKLTSNGWEWDTVYFSNYYSSREYTKKPMTENLD